MLDSFIHATDGAPVNGYDGDKCELTSREAKTGGILRYALMSHFNDYALKSMDATTTSADCQLDDDVCRPVNGATQACGQYSELAAKAVWVVANW